MATRQFKATDLFGANKTPLSNFFQLSCHAALGVRVTEGDTPMFTSLGGAVVFAFWPNEALMGLVCPTLTRFPRIVVELRPKDSAREAHCIIDLEFPIHGDGPAPLTIEMTFPDQLLGLDNMVSRSRQSSYRGVFFNTTPGEYHGNLFELLPVLSSAVSISLGEHLAPASGKKTAQEVAAHFGHTNSDSNTTLKTEVNPDASDGHDEMMDLRICGTGKDAFFEWITEYGDPIGNVLHELELDLAPTNKNDSLHCGVPAAV